MYSNGIGGGAGALPAHVPGAHGQAVPRRVDAGVARPQGERVAEVQAHAAHGAPDGVDPALWTQLTPAERMFYLRASALGPLTYQPGRAQQAAAPARGSRLDVRV